MPGMWIDGYQRAAWANHAWLPRCQCRNCGKRFNERSVGMLNRAHYTSDVIALVVLWRLRYKLSLLDLAETFLTRGFIFSYVRIDAGPDVADTRNCCHATEWVTQCMRASLISG